MDMLSDYRKEIEKIDDELMKLLIERMNLSLKIGQYKKENNIAVFDPQREEELKNKYIAKVDDKYKKGYQEIFETILKVSKDIQL